MLNTYKAWVAKDIEGRKVYWKGKEVVTHTVRFYDYSGKVIATKVVADKNSVTAPNAPVPPNGYIFDGWDKNLSEITSDLDVHPVMRAGVYDVTFVVEDI